MDLQVTTEQTDDIKYTLRLIMILNMDYLKM